MELRQLRYVVAVAHRLSFTQAAAGLSIAQPALSQQIAGLERELGVRLFDRTNRRVVLTDAGRAFVRRAERILADVDRTVEEMTAYAGGLRGRVVVGTYQSFAEYTLPKLLGRFHARYPGIEIALREGMADDLLAGLEANAIDVFIGHVAETRYAGDEQFLAEPLYDDELVIAVGGAHRLASRSTVRMDDLRDEPFIIFRRGSSVTARLLLEARKAQFEPRVVFESVDSLTIRSLVAEGLGVALYPRMLGNMPGPHVSLLSITPERLIRNVALVRRSAPYAPSAETFIDFIRDAMEYA
ncbi:MAG: LysR family transcriptional regulator [Candidatus Eremiobacteraeota bacterium]|nr:LysR family transcriptional regulator [Candidatus Eremiobacteraeota bacterium]